jgi:nitrite reductase (NO-forming)
VRPGGITRIYNGAATGWLVLAALSLALPASARLGLWLPLHLTLAGAASVAICGNVQSFGAALSAGPGPKPRVAWAQFGSVNAGAALIAAGYPAGHRWMVAIGGASFLTSILVLAWIVRNEWTRGLNRRHGSVVGMYGTAVAAVLAGGTIGALLGSGAVTNGSTFLALRRAHMVVNVLGWVSLTIAGTLITLLPTVLRSRMPAWEHSVTIGLLIGGVGLTAGGLALQQDPVAAVGASGFAGGALGVGSLTFRVLRTPRRWPAPVAAKHLVLAQAWFVCGSVAFALAVSRHGAAGFDAFVPVFLATFVAGWIVQTLLGAWQFLVPMQAAGGPAEHRVHLTVTELGANAQVVAFNAGLALVALRAAGLVPNWTARVGGAVALAAGVAAIMKLWLLGPLARIGSIRRRSDVAWGVGEQRHPGR